MNSGYNTPVFLPDFLACLFELDANQPHDKIKFYIVDCLKHLAFRAFAEYDVNEIIRVDSKGKSRKGRLDFYASRGNMEVVGEIDHSVPKKKSIEKCSKYPKALKVFVLRGDKIKYSETQRRIKNIKNYLVIDLKRHKVIFSDIT